MFWQEIYTISRLWNHYWKNSSLENERLYKKQKHKRTNVSLQKTKKTNKKKKCIKEYFQKITEKVILMFYFHFVKAALPEVASLLQMVK